METLFCRIYGRVQMVMMRDFITRKARKLGVMGYVRNMPDGSVEAYGVGEHSALERWRVYLHTGSILSHVERVEVQWNTEVPKDMSDASFRSFNIIF
jgi:acylphosphatase